jgi:hypothetical protein
MMDRYLARTRLLLALVVTVVVAGLGATTASSFEDYYCDGCILPSNGNPAVSVTRYNLSNALQLVTASDWHIYLYNVSSGNQTCDYSGSNGYGGYNPCANYATARCHLLHGTGPSVAYCRSEY